MSWFEINSINYDKKNIKHYKESIFYENYINDINWDILHLSFKHKSLNEIIFLKIFIKKKLFINFLNIPCGFNKSYPNFVYSELIKYINKKFFGINVLLVNNNEYQKLTHKNFNYLNFSSIDNLYKELPLDEKTLIYTYSKNWRHNYKRSLKSNLKFKINNFPNKEEIDELYTKFQSFKNKKIYSNFSKDLYLYLKYFKDYIKNYECRLNGKLLAIRTVIIINNKAWDLFALSEDSARKNYANYYLMHNIFLNLITKKVKFFDFCGVDIKNNKGVFNFKSGTGCNLLKTNHEYIYSNNIFIKFFFIIFLFIRRKFYV